MVNMVIRKWALCLQYHSLTQHLPHTHKPTHICWYTHRDTHIYAHRCTGTHTTYRHTHTCTETHADTHTHVLIDTHTQTHADMQTHTYAQTHADIHTHARGYRHVVTAKSSFLRMKSVSTSEAAFSLWGWHTRPASLHWEGRWPAGSRLVISAVLTDGPHQSCSTYVKQAWQRLSCIFIWFKKLFPSKRKQDTFLSEKSISASFPFHHSNQLCYPHFQWQ